MEEQMVLMVDDQPLVQDREEGELDSLDPQIESLLTMAHRYGVEIGELLKLGQVDDYRAVRLIKDFADGLTAGVNLSPNQLLMIRDKSTSVAAAYAN